MNSILAEFSNQDYATTPTKPTQLFCSIVLHFSCTEVTNYDYYSTTVLTGRIQGRYTSAAPKTLVSGAVYIPPKSVYLKIFYLVFCLLAMTS